MIECILNALAFLFIHFFRNQKGKQFEWKRVIFIIIFENQVDHGWYVCWHLFCKRPLNTLFSVWNICCGFPFLMTVMILSFLRRAYQNLTLPHITKITIKLRLFLHHTTGSVRRTYRSIWKCKGRAKGKPIYINSLCDLREEIFLSSVSVKNAPNKYYIGSTLTRCSVVFFRVLNLFHF